MFPGDSDGQGAFDAEYVDVNEFVDRHSEDGQDDEGENE